MNWILERLWMLSRIHPYSEAWDRKLNDLLDNHKFERIDSYTAKLGGVEVWITNTRYADICPYKPFHIEVTASRKTTNRARRALACDLLGVDRGEKQ